MTRVNSFQSCRVPADLEFLQETVAGRVGKTPPQSGVGNHPQQAFSERRLVADRNEDARDLGFNDFAMRADRGGDNGETMCQPFEHGHGQTLGIGRQHQHIAFAAEHPDFRLVKPTGECQAIENAEIVKK